MSLRSSRAIAVALVTFATFTDILAYSIAVPVLPDLSRRLGASPTTIGLLFASFGVTLLTVSIPMGAMSDRTGRRAPLVGGMIALAAASVLFAFGRSLPWLFTARLIQGAACAIAVVTASATISMVEPVLALHLAANLGVGPARMGLIFGVAAVATTALHPLFGRMSDRWGARRLTLTGLVAMAPGLALLGQTWSFESTIGLYVLAAATVALVITPSLVYMAEATSEAGIGSFGVAYGLYNVAWGAGLLGGPAVGGFL